MGLSLAVFGCRKPKKCTKSNDKKNPRYPALRSSALSTELILPGAVSLSLGVTHLLYWACTRLSGLSGMEVKQRSKDEKRMIWEKQPGYFCQIVIFYRRRILSVRRYWKRMALFEHDSQVLTVYILGTWQAAMYGNYTIPFSRNLNEKEFSSQWWETLFVRVNICGRRDVSLKPAMVMWSMRYWRMHYLSPVQTDATLLANNTLLDATFCVRLHTLLHAFACYWAKFETDQTLKPTTPNIFLFRDRRSVAQQCWICLHCSSNIREFTQRRPWRQRKRQKSNRFRRAKQQLCTCITLFVHFSVVVARLQRETA